MGVLITGLVIFIGVHLTRVLGIKALMVRVTGEALFAIFYSVLSTIGLEQPGKLQEGMRAETCTKHLHQRQVDGHRVGHLATRLHIQDAHGATTRCAAARRA